MKKIAVALIITVMSVFSARADIYIAWAATQGFYVQGDPNTGLNNGGQNLLCQLLWSPDNTISMAFDNAGSHYLDTTSNDLWLGDYISTGVPWGDFSAGAQLYMNTSYGGSTLENGYVFARTFANTAPVSGTKYYQSGSISPTKYIEGATSPDIFDMNFGDPNNGEANQTVQAVPEPGSLALAGLGFAVVLLRRKIRK